MNEQCEAGLRMWYVNLNCESWGDYYNKKNFVNDILLVTFILLTHQ